MTADFSQVTADQFHDDGELAVVHMPTGRRFYTWPYERIGDMSR